MKYLGLHSRETIRKFGTACDGQFFPAGRAYISIQLSSKVIQNNGKTKIGVFNTKQIKIISQNCDFSSKLPRLTCNYPDFWEMN